MKKGISYLQEQRILELYQCSNDRRDWVISQTVGESIVDVRNIIQQYFSNKINFDRGDCVVFHSGMNDFSFPTAHQLDTFTQQDGLIKKSQSAA